MYSYVQENFIQKDISALFAIDPFDDRAREKERETIHKKPER